MTKNVTNWSSWKTFFLTLLLTCFNHIDYTSAENNIGCLFVETLCLEKIEWCFDDYAFGKCLPKYGTKPEQDDLEREPLNEQQSHILSTMLEELQGAGLGWDDLFVQCRMQGALFSLRNNVAMPPNLCANLAPDPQALDPQSPLAFVRFQPPDDAYADEVYFPPDKKGFDDRLYLQPLKSIQPQKKLTSHRIFGSPYSPFDSAVGPYKRSDYLENAVPSEEIENRIKDIKNRIELRKMLAEYESGQLKPPIYYQQDIFENSANRQPAVEDYLPPNMKRQFDTTEDDDFQDDESPKTSFREMSRELHIPKVDLNHHSSKIHRHSDPKLQDAEETNELPLEPLKLNAMRYYDGESNNVMPDESGVYTEGGLVYLSDSRKHQAKVDRNAEARNLLSNMLGFTRHERQDVKKPGPPAAPPPSSQSPHVTPKLSESVDGKQDINKEVLPTHIKDDHLPKIKKVLHTDNDHGPHSVDTDYTHVILKSSVDDWNHGRRIVAALADMLNMQNYFTFSNLARHEITFRVEDNPEKKTAADVARAINDNRFKNNLSRRLGVNVQRAGVGDKTKEVDSAILKREFADEGPNVTRVLIYMVAGAGLAAGVVIVMTLLLIRRHDKKLDKLGGLQKGLIATEASSKDYQELCRARMAGKGNDSPSAGRMTSICKDNEKAPSSRSSTSSWSEEPALTNMDISTGHMVLSYMESHLKNKGRLQREWEALQRYEAEPSSRDTAIQPQCEPLNRPTAPLPYDHSRVVINHLANAEGLDYVNASTITDHDPRAPAYIAAQGPLPSTLAHFWQMVWEQGAVVIVALCKLQENGEIACARYWPEEGAEVYHIYEVNLVSEHIWCEDYLVRSFYLKNLRTGETRTVTQFHFLSWPAGSVPIAAKALLEFRRKVNKSYRGRSCPIVVHSSNGAGRTGAYILLDLVLARMNKGAREIDIAATLEHLRDQRSGLVATRQQFEFVLMAVAEEVHAILKALPANTQNEKRELDSDAVKEQEPEKEATDKADDKTEKKTTAETTKEK